MKKIIIVMVSLSLLFCLSVVVAPGATAYAAPAQQGSIRLENLFKREQIALSNQQQRLDLSNQVVTAAQTWISNSPYAAN